MTKLNTVIAAVSLGIAATGALAQEWPGSTVTIVVPFSPGGSNDTMARFLAAQLDERVDQTVIVENRPGAGTAIGASYVARAEPDGHTILFVSSSLVANAAFEGENLPYTPTEDLQPVSMLARGNMVALGTSQKPATNVAELAEAAGEGPLFYGTFGVGSNGHIGGALLANALGIEMEPVHYPGGSEALLDLSAGRVDVVVGILAGSMSTIESGGGVPLAILGDARDKALPDVETIVEAGFPDATYYSWYGTFVPSGTPDEVVQQINAAFNDVVMSPEGTEFFTNLNTTPVNVTSAEFTETFRSDVGQLQELIVEMNLKPE